MENSVETDQYLVPWCIWPHNHKNIHYNYNKKNSKKMYKKD